MIATTILLVGATVIAWLLLGIGRYTSSLWRATRRERRERSKTATRKPDGQWRYVQGGKAVVWEPLDWDREAADWDALAQEQKRAAVGQCVPQDSSLPPGVADALERGESVTVDLDSK